MQKIDRPKRVIVSTENVVAKEGMALKVTACDIEWHKSGKSILKNQHTFEVKTIEEAAEIRKEIAAYREYFNKGGRT